MMRYLARRLLGVLIVLVLVVTLVFFMLQALPGGPETAFLGVNPTPEKQAAVMKELGLDKPLWVQYLTFVGSIFTFDLGESLTTKTPVATLLSQRLLVTLELGLVSFAFWVLIGLVAGAVAAIRRGGLVDSTVRVGTVVGMSIPNFWLGLLLVLTFGLYIRGVLPSSGWVPFSVDPVGNIKSVILPAFTLGIGSAAVIARTLRSSMIEELGSDHVSFSRAMGVKESLIVRKQALRNAIIPTVTIIGMMFGMFIGGTVLIENVFNLPGVGQLIVSSFLSHDYPVAIAATVLTAGFYLITTLVVDFAYFLIDPRIRASFAKAKGAA